MGTNYYWLSEPCPTCAHSQERMHIGKSSWGWCFGLHVLPEQGLNTYLDWAAKWRGGGIIKDENENNITVEHMERIITQRKHEPTTARDWLLMGYRDEADFHTRNHSQQGLHGLLRHTLIPGHCIGHGEGTWDYLVGEFS